jgi:hypothetical protein
MVACELSDGPTAPDTLSQPTARFAFGGGFGGLFATTNQGELVYVDLDLQTVMKIGEAGTVDGDDLGWTDVASTGNSSLFALSRWSTESMPPSCGSLSNAPCAHLYRLDPQTGAVLNTVGSTGWIQLPDMDFAADSLFGLGYRAGVSTLFVMDTATASLSWIPNDTASVTLGTNPFNGLALIFGGLAVHPITGDLWGVESSGNSTAEVIYRIDRTTGAADSILRLGLNGSPTNFGFDGLEILDDGTFIATRGGSGVAPDSAMWEIDVVPDSLGLAEVQAIPLSVDPSISGTLTGLQTGSFIQVPPLVCDTVIRGQPTQCQLTAVADSVVQWRWIGPVATLIDTVVSDSNTTTWSGVGVASGTVRVDFVSGGQPDSAVAGLVVTPRALSWGPVDWSYAPDSAQYCPAQTDDNRAVYSAHLGGNTYTLGGVQIGRNGPKSTDCADVFIMVEPNVLTKASQAYTGAYVASGPNAGIWYVLTPHFRMDRGSRINSSLGSNGPTVTLVRQQEINACQQANPPVPLMSVNFYTYNNGCQGLSTASLEAGIQQHEAYGTVGLPPAATSDGHQGRIEYFANMPQFDPARRVEGLLSSQDSITLRASVQGAILALDDSLYMAAADVGHTFVKGNYSVDNFVWDTTSTSPQGMRFHKLTIAD